MNELPNYDALKSIVSQYQGSCNALSSLFNLLWGEVRVRKVFVLARSTVETNSWRMYLYLHVDSI